MVNILVVMGAAALAYVIIKFLVGVLNIFALADAYQKLEFQMLTAAGSLSQYKHHAIKIVEIAYAEDPTKAEEFKQVEQKIHEKFDSYSDTFIKSLISKLPYKTEYNDWRSALQYTERLINTSKTNDASKRK